MKMEFPVAAPVRGVIKKLHVAASDSVAVRLLIEIEPELDDHISSDTFDESSQTAKQQQAVVLPKRERAPLQVADVLMAKILGYDVEQELFKRAIAFMKAQKSEILLNTCSDYSARISCKNACFCTAMTMTRPTKHVNPAVSNSAGCANAAWMTTSSAPNSSPDSSTFLSCMD